MIAGTTQLNPRNPSGRLFTGASDGILADNSVRALVITVNSTDTL